MRAASLLLAALLGCVAPDAAPAARSGAPEQEPPALTEATGGPPGSPVDGLSSGRTPGPPEVSEPAAPEVSEPAAPQASEPGAPMALPNARTLLDRYDLDAPSATFALPGRLDEISGLAFSPDGRLFAHDDERGRVHRIDPVTGEVGERFDLVGGSVRDDFEGIAIVGTRFFLVSSHGLLYEFAEADDQAEAAYRVTDTAVGGHCEVEGLDYLPAQDALLLACKVSSPDRGTIVVQRLPLAPTSPRLEPLEIPRAGLRALGVPTDFEPSGIALTPWGTLILVSGSREAILEVDTEGRLLSGARLARGRHPQSEGVAFGPNGTLYLSDERNGGDAHLTAYRPRGSGQGS